MAAAAPPVPICAKAFDTTLRIAWRGAAPAGCRLEVRQLGQTEWRPVPIAAGARAVEVDGLAVQSTYELRLVSPDGSASEVVAIDTMPAGCVPKDKKAKERVEKSSKCAIA